MKIFVAVQQEIEVSDDLTTEKEIEVAVREKLGLTDGDEWVWDTKDIFDDHLC